MRNEMRHRYVAEIAGTFGIVFAPVAFAASGKLNGGDPSLASAAWVSGLSVMAMVYTLGHISAAHFNPAVTLAFAAARRFPWRYVAPYWIAQFGGGILAAAASWALFGAASGAHTPTPEIGRAIGMEAALSFILMFVIVSVATDRRVNGAIPGIAIGMTVVVGVWIGGPLTGGSMNPARSLGPALFAGGAALTRYFVYLVGPPIGAVLAAKLYEAIRGSEEHAQGAPNDLFAALERVAQSAE